MQQDFQDPRDNEPSLNQEEEIAAVLPERYNTPLSESLIKLVDPVALQLAMDALQQAVDQEALYEGLTSPSLEERRAYMVAPLYLEDTREETLSALAFMIVNETDKAAELIGSTSLLLLGRDSEAATADRNIAYAVATADLSERSEPTRVALSNYLQVHGGISDEVREFFTRQIHDPQAGKTERALCLQALHNWQGDTRVIYKDALRRIEASDVPAGVDLDLFAEHSDPEQPHRFSKETIDAIVALVEQTDKESERYQAFRALANAAGNEATVSRAMYDLLNVENQELGVVMFAANIIAIYSDNLDDPEAFIAPFVDRLAENESLTHALFGDTLSKIAATAFFAGRPVRDDIIDVLPAVYKLAKSDLPEMQAAALRIFAFVGEEAADAIPEIGALLSSEHEQVRRLAGVAAHKLGQQVGMLRPVLMEGAQCHEDEYSRVLSALSLAGLDFELEANISVRTDVTAYEERHYETIACLQSLYGGLSSELVQHGVLITLARIVEDSEDVAEIVSDALETSSPLLHEAALASVMLFEQIDDRILEAVRRFSNTESGELSEQAKKIYDYFKQMNDDEAGGQDW